MGNKQFSSSKKVIITLYVKNIMDNIEDIGNGKFRIGKVNIAIDSSRILEIADEYGNKCRISGPAGQTNLSNYLLDIRKSKSNSGSLINDTNISKQKFVIAPKSEEKTNNNIDKIVKNIDIPSIIKQPPDEEMQQQYARYLKLEQRCNELEKENEIYKTNASKLEKEKYDIKDQMTCIKKEKQEIENKARLSIEEQIRLEEKYQKIEQEKEQASDLVEYLNKEFKNIAKDVNKISVEKDKLDRLRISHEDEIAQNHLYEENLLKEKQEIQNKLLKAVRTKELYEDKLKLIDKNNTLLEDKISNLQAQYNKLKSEAKD